VFRSSLVQVVSASIDRLMNGGVPRSSRKVSLMTVTLIINIGVVWAARGEAAA
jgi:hypothetical protein